MSKRGKGGNGAKGKKRVKGVVEKDAEVIKAKPKGSGNSKVNGLGSGEHVRAAVLVRNGLICCMRPEGLSRDSVAVEICHHSSDKSLVVCSLYVENGKFPLKFLNRVGDAPWMRSGRVVIGCDANARHTIWNSKFCNPRGRR